MISTTTVGVRKCVWECVGMWVCAQVCKGVCGYLQGWAGVHRCALVGVKACGCLRVCAWDEFSEYLLENRVPTSADFNTYPIRILICNIATHAQCSSNKL